MYGFYFETLPKFNMEPKNDGFQQGISYSRVPLSRSMLTLFGLYKRQAETLRRVLHARLQEQEPILKLWQVSGNVNHHAA